MARYEGQNQGMRDYLIAFLDLDFDALITIYRMNRSRHRFGIGVNGGVTRKAVEEFINGSVGFAPEVSSYFEGKRFEEGGLISFVRDGNERILGFTTYEVKE